MNLENIALAVAIISGVLVPILLTAVFPWVLSINAKVAAIVEKLTALGQRIEEDVRQHQRLEAALADHERRLVDHEHRITVIAERVADAP